MPDPCPPFLRVDPARSARAAAGLRAAHGLPPDAALVFIHPGSGGSAPNLAPEAYAALARGLLKKAIDATKIQQELGWERSLQFEEGIDITIDWYLANEDWLNHVTSGAYQAYYTELYGSH